MAENKTTGFRKAATLLLLLTLTVCWTVQAQAQSRPLLPTKRGGFVRPSPQAVQPGVTPKPATEAVGKRTDDGRVALTFRDVDIRVLIQFISKLTGKTYVVSDKVSGRATIITPGPVTIKEAVRILGSVLEVNGYTTVDQGEVIKVIPVQGARREGVDVLPSGKMASPSSEAMVTQMVTLNHAQAREVRAILVPLAGRHAYVTAHNETNSLIITDVASNAHRLALLAKRLDVPGSGAKLVVIRLQYAKATDVATALKNLFSTRTQSAVQGKAPVLQGPQDEGLLALADERSNSLILLGSKTNLSKARELVAKLDVADVEGQFNIHVVHLRYAVATDMAEVLGQLAGGTPAVQTAAADTQKGKPKAEKVKKLSSEVRMVADKATNSLIVQASPQEFKVLEAIIAQLDRPRTMVYVEAVILEMSATKSLDFGVTWQGAVEEGGGAGFAGVGGAVSTDALTKTVGGLSMGIIGSSITVGGITFPNLSALVRAAQTDTDIRVVATPQILTADNEEASIQVAQNLPFLTRVDQGTADNSRSIQSYDYKDVGYVLKVTPRISDNGVVRMNLEAEHKSVVQSSITDSEGNTLLAPTTNVRTAKTTVITPNNDIVVIGGLIGNETETTGTQVPCLGSIPVAGWLFKQTGDKGTRTNMLIFLSPHILTSYGEARKLTDEKIKEGQQGAPQRPEDILKDYRPKTPDPAILDRMREKELD